MALVIAVCTMFYLFYQEPRLCDKVESSNVHCSCRKSVNVNKYIALRSEGVQCREQCDL